MNTEREIEKEPFASL